MITIVMAERQRYFDVTELSNRQYKMLDNRFLMAMLYEDISFCKELLEKHV